jgi:hypothetical protein
MKFCTLVVTISTHCVCVCEILFVIQSSLRESNTFLRLSSPLESLLQSRYPRHDIYCFELYCSLWSPCLVIPKVVVYCGCAFWTWLCFSLTCCVRIKGVPACLEERGVCHGWLYRRLILASTWDVDSESFIPLASPVRWKRPAPKFSLSTPWRYIGGVEVYVHVSLTSALDGGEWLTSRPGRFIPGKEPLYPWNRRLGEPQSRSGRFGEEKNPMSLPGLEPRSVSRPCYDVNT